MRAGPGSLAMLSLGILLGRAGIARADGGQPGALWADPATTLHVLGSAGIGASDNVLGAPDVPPPGVEGIGPPVADVAIQFAPGVALLHDGPRARFALSYSHPMLLYVLHPLAEGSGDLADFAGMFALSPKDDLDAHLSLSRFTTNLANLNVAPGQGDIGAVRMGSDTMLDVSAAHAYFHALSPSWSLLATGTAALGIPLPVSSGGSMFAGTWNLGPRLALPRHLLGVSATMMVARPLVHDPVNNGFYADQALVVGAEGRWSWDWSRRWSSQASAGLVAPVIGDVPTARPIGSATIRYDDPLGYGATLGWTRGYVPNVVTGQTYYSDTIALHGNLPLVPSAHLMGLCTAGFAWSRVVDALQGIDTSTVKTAVANVAVGWYPVGLPRFILSYQFTKQFDAPDGQVLLPNFHRNIVMLTMEYMFPERRLVIAGGPPGRADGADRAVIGP